MTLICANTKMGYFKNPIIIKILAKNPSDEYLTMGFWWEGPGMATPLLVLSAFLVS